MTVAVELALVVAGIASTVAFAYGVFAAGDWLLSRRRPAPAELMNCGCRSAGVIYTCMSCGNTRCDDHRKDGHFCPECEDCGFRRGYPVHEWNPETRKLTVIGGER